MKNLALSILSFLFLAISAKSQVITDSAFVYNQIYNGVINSSYIFEGEVLSTECFYNPTNDYIYTSNSVQVNQSWKDKPGKELKKGDIVEVITRGGSVGDHTLWISHQIGFVPGQRGMFLCDYASTLNYPSNPNSTTPNAEIFTLHDGLYFDYDYSQNYVSASYANVNFPCLRKLYEVLDPTYIADCLDVFPDALLYEQKYGEFEQMRDNLLLDVAGSGGILTYHIENAGTTTIMEKISSSLTLLLLPKLQFILDYPHYFLTIVLPHLA